jgi:hypothetical protein
MALVCAGGCANFSAIAPGDTAQSVSDRVGRPATAWMNGDGSEVWEYPQGPLGHQTYMVTLGPDHAVREVRQVLSERYFSKVQPGMSRDEVRRMLGKPAETSIFSIRDEEVWTWRYMEPGPMLFHTVFDRTAGTVRTTLREDESLDLESDE